MTSRIHILSRTDRDQSAVTTLERLAPVELLRLDPDQPDPLLRRIGLSHDETIIYTSPTMFIAITGIDEGRDALSELFTGQPTTPQVATPQVGIDDQPLPTPDPHVHSADTPARPASPPPATSPPAVVLPTPPPAVTAGSPSRAATPTAPTPAHTRINRAYILQRLHIRINNRLNPAGTTHAKEHTR